MENCFDQEDGKFIVLINAEEQYSLWPHWKDIPGGWKHTGQEGSKAECLQYVEDSWTDMRPLSLRNWMEKEQLS